MKRLGTVCLMLAALVALAGAAANRTEVYADTVGGRWGLFGSGGAMGYGAYLVPVQNASTTDTLEPGEPVGGDTSEVTVIAINNVGDGRTLFSAADTTIDDSLATHGLDTLGTFRDPYGYPRPRYDSAGNPAYKIHLRMVHADTASVRVYGRNADGMPARILWSATTGATTDTVFAALFAVVESVVVTGNAEADSVTVKAAPINAVKVNTVLKTSIGADAYVGTVQSRILPRHRGWAQWSGAGKVKVKADANDIKAGYWLAPSGTAGYADASSDKPDLAIGRVTAYSQADGLASADLFPFDYSGFSFIIVLDAYARETLAAVVDTVRGEAAKAQDTANVALAMASTIFDVFNPSDFVIPANHGPTLAQADGTHLSYDALCFDSTATCTTYLNFAVRRPAFGQVSDRCTLDIYWTSPTTSEGNVAWVYQDMSQGDGELLDSAFTGLGYVSDGAQGLGVVHVASLPLDASAWGDRNFVSVRIWRGPDGEVDTFTGEPRLIMAMIRYQWHDGTEPEPQ